MENNDYLCTEDMSEEDRKDYIEIGLNSLLLGTGKENLVQKH